MKGLLKIGALIAGGFLVMRYMGEAGANLPTIPTPEPPPPAQTPPAAGAVDVRRAASDRAYAETIGAAVTYNVHQWNAIAEQAGVPNPGTDFAEWGDPNLRITATEFHRRRSAAGLQGLLNTWRGNA